MNTYRNLSQFSVSVAKLWWKYQQHFLDSWLTGSEWQFTYLSTENTRAILPMARILLRMTSLRAEAVAPDGVRGHKESNRRHFLHHNVSGWDSILHFDPVNGSLITLPLTLSTHHNMLPPYTNHSAMFGFHGAYLDCAKDYYFHRTSQLSDLRLQQWLFFPDGKIFRWIVLGQIAVWLHVERGSGKWVGMELGGVADMGEGGATGSRWRDTLVKFGRFSPGSHTQVGFIN